MPVDSNAAAWGLPQVLDFFDQARATTSEVYASEWFFLKDELRPGIHVLDVGCAQGGFATVMAEHLDDFVYSGIDINAGMVERAKAKHPRHTFHHVEGTDWSALGNQQFDLVLVLGILHLHESWRDTLRAAWARTRGTLIFDLREVSGPTIEDKSHSYFRMDFHGGDTRHTEAHLPYVLVNTAEALALVQDVCGLEAKVERYGYVHPVSGSAVTPDTAVMATTYCIRRPGP